MAVKLALFKLADAALDMVIKACMRGQTWLDLHWPIKDDDIEDMLHQAYDLHGHSNAVHIPRRRK